MFERLVDLLIGFMELFRFWVVLDEFEEGIILTLGRIRRKRFLGLRGGYLIGPGIHLIWPMAIEHALVDNVVSTPTQLRPQSLTTKDGKDIVVSAIVTWKIKNIERMLLKVEGARDALPNVCSAVLGVMVEQSTWAEMCDPAWTESLGKAVRAKAMKWGMEVEEVALADKTQSVSIRLIGGAPQLQQELE